VIGVGAWTCCVRSARGRSLSGVESLRIPFPTGAERRQGRTDAELFGYPVQAKPCRGHVAFVDDDRCIWCGRWTAMTIIRTFAERAQKVAAEG
jgi:hypothetical protein